MANETARLLHPALTLTSVPPLYDLDLLRSLRGSRIARQVRVLAVIGAHRLDEAPLIARIFPRLERLYAFEPLPGPLQALRERAAADPRLQVFACAISDQDGEARFHVTSNDGESSSLLPLGTHQQWFPQVHVDRTVTVPTRRLESVLQEHRLPPPDALLVDVQGAEHQVLASLSAGLLQGVRLIYTEVSLEPLYEGGRVLADVEALLAPRLIRVAYAPIDARVVVHGNAIFVPADWGPTALEPMLHERLRRRWHEWRRRWRPR